jgi:hypothetical protein
MKRFIQSTIRFLFVTAVLMFGGILPSFAADLQMFSNARLINDPVNDGDSFLVEADGKPLHIISRMLKNSGKRAFPQSPTAPVRV